MRERERERDSETDREKDRERQLQSARERQIQRDRKGKRARERERQKAEERERKPERERARETSYCHPPTAGMHRSPLIMACAEQYISGGGLLRLKSSILYVENHSHLVGGRGGEQRSVRPDLWVIQRK